MLHSQSSDSMDSSSDVDGATAVAADTVVG